MQRDFQPTVYLLASRKNGAIDTGVTSDLIRRLHEHREGVVPGFTKEHGIKRLAWFEQHSTMGYAITREAHQEVVAQVEAGTDREGQSRLA